MECGLVWAQVLKDHISAIHQEIARFECGQCGHKNYYKHNLQSHVQNNHKEEEAIIVKIKSESHEGEKVKVLKVKQGKKEKSKKGSSGHHKSQNGKERKKYDCTECEYSTDRGTSLKYHISAIHQKLVRYKCSHCDYKSYFKHHIKLHVGKKHNGEMAYILKIGCYQCQDGEPHDQHEKAFELQEKYQGLLKRKESSKMHKKRTISSTTKCTECDSMFRNIKLRLEHFKESHPGKNIYHCTHCDYGSNYLANLKDHVNSLHEKIALVCDKCDFYTSWRKLFHCHMREEHGCHQYKSKHFDGKPLLCDNCAFTTTSKAKFEIHKYQDHNQKQFQCEKCDHRTSYKSNLKIHMREIHSELMLPCDKCDFTTKTQQKLKHHVESIHKGIKYNCKNCQYQTTRSVCLRIHVKRVHKS